MESVIQMSAQTQLRDHVRKPLLRSACAQAIAQLLLTQWCREEHRPLQRLYELEPADRQRFIGEGEFITNWSLSPDRAETAVMAMADVFCADGCGRSIFDYPLRVQAHYYHLAVSALHALQANVKDVPPDAHYREQLCRLVDAVAPKAVQS